MIRIRKINIYESPILTVKHNNTAVHCVLDSGATASLISLRKAKQLKLLISPTVHRAIQVDGFSDLKIIGEVHTEFTRGDLTLYFNALVVNKLGTDILGGTNFLKDNDIYSRMAKDTIVIKGSNVFQSTPATILEMEMNASAAQLVRVHKTQTITSNVNYHPIFHLPEFFLQSRSKVHYSTILSSYRLLIIIYIFLMINSIQLMLRKMNRWLRSAFLLWMKILTDSA